MRVFAECSSLRPVGSPFAVQTKGTSPPEVRIVAVYCSPTVPLCNEWVMILTWAKVREERQRQKIQIKGRMVLYLLQTHDFGQNQKYLRGTESITNTSHPRAATRGRFIPSGL